MISAEDNPKSLKFFDAYQNAFSNFTKKKKEC
jgi:hypothetical protein